MNRKIKTVLLGCAAVLTLSATADVELKNAVIVHPDTMKGWDKDAVGDMKTALEKMTGKTYTVQPESKAPASGVKIYIGNTQAAAKAGIDPEKMESQQFRMKAGDGKVFLIGGSPTGTSYAVSTFLQTQFGVYWLAGDCQVYPKNADPKVKDLDKTQKPDVTDRFVYSRLDRSFEPKTQEKWHTYHRINRMYWPTADRIKPNTRISPVLQYCHSFYKLVPPEKYFKDHPEYYSMRFNGQRDWHGRGGLCLSNKEVWDVTLKELTALIRNDRKKNPKTPPTVYTVAPQDSPERYLCHCPECKKRVDQDGSYFVLLSEFVNYLAREVRKISPDIWIGTAINLRSDNPDVNFKLENNVIFVHADRSSHSNFFYPLSDPMNREGYEYIKKWGSKVPVLGLWDYYWLPGNDQPVVAVDAIIGDCRLFREINLFSIFKESEFHFGKYNTFLSFHQLQNFLELQLLFDAAQDPEKLINDFMDGYYGAAAPEMKEYLALLRKAQREKPITMEVWRQEENNRLFPHVTLEFLEKAYALVKKGLAKVKNDKRLAARVSWELFSITHSGLRFYRNNPAKYKQLQEEYKAVVLLNLETLHLKPRLEAQVRQELAAELSAADTKFSDLPPELASLPADQLIAVPSKYLVGYAPLNVNRVADPESSQPIALVKKPFGKSQKQKLLPIVAEVSMMKKSKIKSIISLGIKKAPADEKYHWYKIGTATLEYGCWIHVEWAMRLMLRDFYTMPSGNGTDPNRYEIWASIRMTGPGYVPGSTRENALYFDRGLLVRKP